MGRSIHTEILIEAPPEHVWAVLCDWARYGEWNPLMVELTGEQRVGARLDVALKLGEKKMRFRPTLKVFEPGHRFQWLGHTGFRGLFDGAHGFTVERAGESGTRFVHDEQFRGVLAGLMLRFIGEQTEAGFRSMNEALKHRCESSTGSSPSTA